MEAQAGIPFASQSVQEVADMVRDLNLGTQNKSKAQYKKISFSVRESPDHLTVDSWKLRDWDYKKGANLPTNARGLFTTKNQNGEPEIAVRGYDKFFNVDEIDRTKWINIERDTTGPYELSLKENGCIILFGGLSDGSLFISSKNSTGNPHANAAEGWIDRQLEAIGKTRQDLARELRKRNATAVAELCDDDFEEHILAYRGDFAGLYLHGININIPQFMTYPSAEVQTFADEWGFKRTDFLVKNDVPSIRAFLAETAKSGSYGGREVEGFVIRCKSRIASGPNQDWFFKYKYEEPYLMYRQWRECTKALICGKPPHYNKHIKITKEYLIFAKKRLAQDPKLGQSYNNNHGIIVLRDEFLREKNLTGSDIILQELNPYNSQIVDKDIILVPIATIGCGKTTIGTALRCLFGWGHVQNDNIVGGSKPSKFTKEVLAQLEDVPVVYADRNNGQRRERQQITENVHDLKPNVRLIALYFDHSEENIDEIRKITQERVFSRGNNHQTIQAASNQSKAVGIMEGFIQRFEKLDPSVGPDNGFEAVIELDATLDSRHNLESVVRQLYSLFPQLFKCMPTSKDMDDAINYALYEYKPELRHDVSRGSQNENKASFSRAAISKNRALEYVAVGVPRNTILNELENVFNDLPANISRFFHQLQKTQRIQSNFHITLIHRASASLHPELWERYRGIWEATGSTGHKLGTCRFHLERVVWDDKIMAIVVRIIDAEWDCANLVPHITVGTKGNEIKPKESNDLLKRWLEVGSSTETGISDVVVKGNVTLIGDVDGVLSRR